MQINEIYRDIVVVLCLNYSKDIKGLKYIIVTLLTLFWIFYATPAILLRIPYVQQKVATTATRELSERLGVPVRIGNVDIEWFNRLVLENLYLEDESGTVLFDANHVSAGFEILPLLNGRIVFSTVRLFGFSVNLHKETPADKLNLQFVIDAFASKDTVKAIQYRPAFQLDLNTPGKFPLRCEECSHYPGKFNAKHIDIRNISAKISMKAFNKDSLNANIKKMSFDEASGFSLNKLSLNIVANKDSAIINNFEIKLPETDLKIDRAHIHTGEAVSASDLLDHSPVELNIAPSQICLKDLSAFVPAFRNFSKPSNFRPRHRAT